MKVVPAPRTAAANHARHANTIAAVQRVSDAVTRIHKERSPLTVAAVARRAGVSRTFLYTNPGARQAVTEAIGQTGTRREQAHAAQHEQLEASFRQRALNAEDALKNANAEIRKQRNQIGELMGQIRDLQAEWTEQAIQHVTTENTTLKQRVRQLTADHRTLQDRLQAARSTMRFQDRRLADLETQIVDPQHFQEPLRLVKPNATDLVSLQ